MSSSLELTPLPPLLGSDGPLDGRFRLDGPTSLDEIGWRCPVVDTQTGRPATLRVVQTADRRNATIAATRLAELPPRLSKTARRLTVGHHESHVYAVFERTSGFPLSSLVGPGYGLPLRTFVPIASQILAPLCTLHGQGLAVGGVRAEDVILHRAHGRSHLVKVEDLGFRAVTSPMATTLRPRPEDDVRSVGQLFCRMLTGSAVLSQDEAGAATGFDDEIPQALIDLIARCQNPSRSGAPTHAHDVIAELVRCLPAALFRLPVTGQSDIDSMSSASMSGRTESDGPVPSASDTMMHAPVPARRRSLGPRTIAGLAAVGVALGASLALAVDRVRPRASLTVDTVAPIFERDISSLVTSLPRRTASSSPSQSNLTVEPKPREEPLSFIPPEVVQASIPPPPPAIDPAPPPSKRSETRRDHGPTRSRDRRTEPTPISSPPAGRPAGVTRDTPSRAVRSPESSMFLGRSSSRRKLDPRPPPSRTNALLLPWEPPGS